jgi:hypothetical protein
VRNALFIAVAAASYIAPQAQAATFTVTYNGQASNAANQTVVANNPAFVLSVGSPSPANCFSDEKKRGVRAVGRHELLGWIQSRLY